MTQSLIVLLITSQKVVMKEWSLAHTIYSQVTSDLYNYSNYNSTKVFAVPKFILKFVEYIKVDLMIIKFKLTIIIIFKLIILNIILLIILELIRIFTLDLVNN